MMMRSLPPPRRPRARPEIRDPDTTRLLKEGMSKLYQPVADADFDDLMVKLAAQK